MTEASQPLPDGKSHRSPSVAVLAIGTLLYFIACVPAFDRSGWPPTDHFWEAMTWLWVVPIPIFTLIIPSGRSSKTALLVFAIASGVIDAWTSPFVQMNPHPTFDFELCADNFITCGPLHLVLTAIIASLSRLAYKFAGAVPGSVERLLPHNRPRLRRWIIAFILLVAGIAPFAYRYAAVAADARAGAALADKDWAAQKAVIYLGDPMSNRRVGDYLFDSPFDPDSGLELKASWLRQTTPGYNARVRALIEIHGIPKWSLKSRFVSDADMIAMLSAKDMTKVTSYPDDLTPDVVLMRQGSITRWGRNIGSQSDMLDVETRNQDFMTTDLLAYREEKDPVYVGQSPKYANTYFIRSGDSVMACTSDG
jgi:hypothetical protein